MEQPAETPRISANGLVEFMTDNFIGRELLLRRYKYDYPGRRVFVPYYQPTLTAIRRYHREGNDPGVFNAALADLESRVASAGTPQQRARFQGNIRALDSYQRNFGNRQFEILTQRRYRPLQVSGITVSCTPDLEVLEFEEHLYLLINFSVTQADPESVATLCQLLFRTVQQAEAPIEPSQVRFLDVTSGQDLRWTGKGSKRWAQIEAALRQYAALWSQV